MPLRNERMSESPFAFFRGSAAVMASDLAATPSSGIRVQLCGDAHLSNFGGYASPDRALVFDLNDFDETLPGPWEWDVKRLVTSVEIAARDREYGDRKRRDIVLATARAYRRAMREFASARLLDVWYSRITLADIRDSLGLLRPVEGPERIRPPGREGHAQGQRPGDIEADRSDRWDGPGSAATHPSWCLSPTSWTRMPTSSWRRWSVRPCGAIGTASLARADTSSSSSGTPTWHARWSASAVSGPGPGRF